MRHFQLTALVPVRRSGPTSFGRDWSCLCALAARSLLESSADDLDLLFSSPNHFPPRTLHSILTFSRRLLESSGLACDSVHRVAHFPRGGRCRWDMCNTGYELGPGSGGILACTLGGGEPREIVITYPPTPGAPLAPVVQHQAQQPPKGFQRVQHRLPSIGTLPF
ncbi:hypothetical protein DNTS_007732 [Danionella cerebrum]|uniref:Uncharacterized protein n=1 Tax=Danionella cerebrum TaxID=2873325 RepID=A0A553QTQ1_9TELE|nr:hypothetical protein DNTS_007732 [Danionella translucida]